MGDVGAPALGQHRGWRESPGDTTWLEAFDTWTFHYYNGGYYGGSPARLRGNLAHLAGDDTALAHYEQAILDHQLLGAVPFLAATRLDQAQLWLDRGDGGRAAAHAHAALDDIRDLPLTRRRNQALHLLERVDK